MNLNSKQTHDLKDKDFGERNKMLHPDKEVDKMLCDSAVLVKHLSNDINVVHVAHCMSTVENYQLKVRGVDLRTTFTKLAVVDQKRQKIREKSL